MHDGHNTAFSKLRARDASNSRHHHHLSTSTSVTRVMSEDIKPDVKPDVQKIQLQVSFSGNSERFAFEYTCSCLTSFASNQLSSSRSNDLKHLRKSSMLQR